MTFTERQSNGQDFSEPQLKAWNISENGFPSKGSTSDKLRFLLNYAILAPSSHNTQPWFFKIINDGIELHADRTRAVPVVDPDDRELIISCGAALSYLQLAMHHFGFADKIELKSKPNEDLVAKVAINGMYRPQKDEDALFNAITQRRTNRSRFENRKVHAELLLSLQRIARDHGIWLDTFEGDRKNAIAQLVWEGDKMQMADRRFRRELAAWIHPNRSDSKDGMPGYAHGMPDLASYMGPFLIRTFDMGKGQAAKDKELAIGSPALAVLGSDGDELLDWIRTGQAIARILLFARANDIWTSFMNQPIEVLELRPRLREILGRSNGFPQLLVRMRYGNAVKPTPRRKLEDVIS